MPVRKTSSKRKTTVRKTSPKRKGSQRKKMSVDYDRIKGTPREAASNAGSKISGGYAQGKAVDSYLEKQGEAPKGEDKFYEHGTRGMKLPKRKTSPKRKTTVRKTSAK